MELGVPELLLILVIVILLFGVGRIGKIAGELSGGIRAFREGLKGNEPTAAAALLNEQSTSLVSTAEEVKTTPDDESGTTA